MPRQEQGAGRAGGDNRRGGGQRQDRRTKSAELQEGKAANNSVQQQQGATFYTRFYILYPWHSVADAHEVCPIVVLGMEQV